MYFPPQPHREKSIAIATGILSCYHYNNQSAHRPQSEALGRQISFKKPKQRRRNWKIAK